MSGRSLAYLAGIPVTEVKWLRGARGKALEREGIATVADLLLHTPRRYVDRSVTLPLRDLREGEEATVIADVAKVSLRRPRRNLNIVEVVLYDGTGTLTLVWFNQPYRAKHFSPETEVAVSGKVERFRGKLQMNNPAVDNFSHDSLAIGRVMPIHPKVAKVPPWELRRAIYNALGRARPISDPLPAEIRDRLRLIDRDKALSDIHFPESLDDVPEAKRRLIFDELFRLEVSLALSKQKAVDQAIGIQHEPNGELLDPFVNGLPFILTRAQVRSIEELAADLTSSHPMHRLLQGEVGSGKTVVAVSGLLIAVEGSHQGAVMAPTEVLAEQHYLAIRHLLQSAGLGPVTGSLFDTDAGPRSVTLALLTASRAELNFRDLGSATREEVLSLVAKGEVDIVVGTHALIQEGVHFSKLGMAVVDEQHRFGVHQRVKLKEKGQEADPDLLIMTATPIPRTLAMTLYGDLDVTLLDEMPAGRPRVETHTVSWGRLDNVYDRIRRQVAEGHQVFVVCPLVDDSTKVEAASATASYDRLRADLGELSIGLLHGQMRPRDKEEVMAAFRAGELDVLVATTVIEVGIDVPNATLMVVEDAQRFGLSQLHQLRGRVGRGSAPAACILVTDAVGQQAGGGEAEERIRAMVSTNDGFALADEDLRIRGQGTVFGARQSGATDLKLADILRDVKLLAKARREAFGLVASDPLLGDHPDMADEVRALLGEGAGWLSIS